MKIEYVDITNEDFTAKMKSYKNSLDGLFEESKSLEKEIKGNLKTLNYE